ncbi:MAG: Histone-lysine N-methyltransferase setd1b [Paramarteilia canceri]
MSDADGRESEENEELRLARNWRLIADPAAGDEDRIYRIGGFIAGLHDPKYDHLNDPELYDPRDKGGGAFLAEIKNRKSILIPSIFDESFGFEAINTCRVILSRLPSRLVSTRILMALCSKFGPVRNIVLSSNSSIAKVEFYDPTNASECAFSLNKSQQLYTVIEALLDFDNESSFDPKHYPNETMYINPEYEYNIENMESTYDKFIEDKYLDEFCCLKSFGIGHFNVSSKITERTNFETRVADFKNLKSQVLWNVFEIEVEEQYNSEDILDNNVNKNSHKMVENGNDKIVNDPPLKVQKIDEDSVNQSSHLIDQKFRYISIVSALMNEIYASCYLQLKKHSFYPIIRDMIVKNYSNTGKLVNVDEKVVRNSIPDVLTPNMDSEIYQRSISILRFKKQKMENKNLKESQINDIDNDIEDSYDESSESNNFSDSKISKFGFQINFNDDNLKPSTIIEYKKAMSKDDYLPNCVKDIMKNQIENCRYIELRSINKEKGVPTDHSNISLSGAKKRVANANGLKKPRSGLARHSRRSKATQHDDSVLVINNIRIDDELNLLNPKIDLEDLYLLIESTENVFLNMLFAKMILKEKNELNMNQYEMLNYIILNDEERKILISKSLYKYGIQNLINSTQEEFSKVGLNINSKSHHRDQRSSFRKLTPIMDLNSRPNKKLSSRENILRFGMSAIDCVGLFSFSKCSENELLIEYCGEIIRPSVADFREEYVYKTSNDSTSYLFKIDDNIIVDATCVGNNARFINHSCNPNSYAKVVTLNGTKHLGIFSRREIAVGEEITYDYKFPIEDNKIICKCGAKNCRNYLN